MGIKQSFATALRRVRRARKVTQEDFSVVSSRTYLSALERGLQSPTLEKIEELAGVLQVHPLTLIALAYVDHNHLDKLPELLRQVQDEIGQILPEASPRQ